MNLITHPKKLKSSIIFVPVHLAEIGMCALRHSSDGNSYLLMPQTVSRVCMLKSSGYVYQFAISNNDVFIANIPVGFILKKQDLVALKSGKNAVLILHAADLHPSYY